MSEDEKRRQLAETLMRIRELDRTSACLQACLQDARRAYGYLYEGLDTPNVLIKPTGRVPSLLAATVDAQPIRPTFP